MRKRWSFWAKPSDSSEFPSFPIRAKPSKAKAIYKLCCDPKRWVPPLLVLGLAVVIVVPEYQMRGVSDRDKRAELIDKSRGTWTQIVVALSLGLYFTYRNVLATEKNLSLTERKHDADRFSGATNLLSSHNSYQRLAAINMLEQIGLASEENMWLVVDAMTAYLRDSHSAGSPPANKDHKTIQKPEPEVSAVIRALHVLSDAFPNSVPTAGDWIINSGLLLQQRTFNLQGVNLERIKISDSNFQLISLAHADLSWAVIVCSNFAGANLFGANLSNAVIRWVSLRDSDLSRAQLGEASLKEVDLSYANLHRVMLHGADLVDVRGLTQEQLDQALGDESTMLPSHLKMPEHWKIASANNPTPGNPEELVE